MSFLLHHRVKVIRFANDSFGWMLKKKSTMLPKIILLLLLIKMPVRGI